MRNNSNWSIALTFLGQFKVHLLTHLNLYFQQLVSSVHNYFSAWSFNIR
jgi:hypothetical protein